MKLGVVIVTYNRLELLKECVDACINQTKKFSKIYIVNNASTDGTKEYLDSLKNKSIHIVHSDKNLGGAGGFYLGLKEASISDLDYLLIIDDDAIIDKYYNENIHVHMLKNEKNIVGYSGSVLTDGQIQYEHRRYLAKGFKQKNSILSDYNKEYFDYDLSTFCGVFMSLDIIRKIGLPKKEFFIWYDDTEYCLRAIKYGKIRNVNKSLLNHKTKINVVNGYNWKSYYGLRNNYVILREHYSKFRLYNYVFKMFIHIILGRVLSILKNNDYYGKISEIYFDAFRDAKNNNMGINEKYTYKYKLEK